MNGNGWLNLLKQRMMLITCCGNLFHGITFVQILYLLPYYFMACRSMSVLRTGVANKYILLNNTTDVLLVVLIHINTRLLNTDFHRIQSLQSSYDEGCIISMVYPPRIFIHYP
jgi:hypothetical protein